MMDKTQSAIQTCPALALPDGREVLDMFRQQVFRAMVFFAKVEIKTGSLPAGASKTATAKNWLSSVLAHAKRFMIGPLLEQGERLRNLMMVASSTVGAFMAGHAGKDVTELRSMVQDLQSGAANDSAPRDVKQEWWDSTFPDAPDGMVPMDQFLPP